MFKAEGLMNTWSKFPFLRIVIPFITGIIFYHDFELSSSLFLPVCILSLGSLFFWNIFLRMPDFHNRWIYGLMINLVLISSALSLAWLLDDRNSDSHFMNHQSATVLLYYAEVIEPAVERPNSFRLVLKVNQLAIEELSQNSGLGNQKIVENPGYKKHPASGKLLCYIDKDAIVPDYGDILVFARKPFNPESPGNPEEFNYERYLRDNNIFHIVYLHDGDFIISKRNGGRSLRSFAIGKRDAFLKKLNDEGLEMPELSVAAAMLTGYDDLLDSDQRKEYTNAGVIHILCVSGLHVGVIFFLAEIAMGLLKRNRFTVIVKPVLILLIIWFYALFTGLAAPVLRASFMFSLLVIGRGIKRKPQTLNTLGAAAFILLALNPNVLYNIGFQLSFSAVTGILIFHRFFQESWKPVNPLLINFWNLISVSLSAQIFTIPIILYYFGQFPVYFILSNLIAIPLSGIIIYTGLASAFLSFIPLLGKITVFILSTELKVLNYSVSLIEGIPGAVINDIYLSLAGAIMMFIFLSGLILFMMKNNKKWLFTSLICLCVLMVLSATRYYSLQNNKLLVFHKVRNHTLVSFIDSQKHSIIADSTIINNPDFFKFHYQGLARKYGLYDPVFKGMNTDDKKKSLPEFLSFNGRRLVFINRRCVLPDNSRLDNVDFVLLCNNPFISTSQLAGCFPGAKIVVDCSCSNDFRRKVFEDTGKLGIEAYDLNNEALIVKL